MKYYDVNFLNPLINEISFTVGDYINPEFGLRRDSLVEGDSISIEQQEDGKLKISLSTEPTTPEE